MISFWIAAVCLLAGALLFVLPPLLSGGRSARAVSRRGVNLAVYQDQLKELDADLVAGNISEEQHRQAKQEIEVRVIEDVPEETGGAASRARPIWLIVLLGVAVPALSVGAYLRLGNPAAINPAAVAPHDESGHAMSPEQIEARVQALKGRLRSKPGDVEGWVMLARTQIFLGHHAEAAESLKEANRLVPGNADLLADYADTLAMARDKQLAGEPEALVQQALKVDPKHVKSLALAGTAAFDRGDYAAAAGYWERILVQLPPGSPSAQSVAAGIADARKRGGLPASAPTPAGAAAAGATVTGQVSLAPSLASRVKPGDTLFIFARAETGPPMPLVILRRAAGELPLEFRLDDSMAMQPDRRLSDFPKVVVVARISKSGLAQPGPDDLSGQSPPVAPGGRVSIVIDKAGP